MTKVIDCSGMGEETKTELKPIEITHFICGSNGRWDGGQPQEYIARKGVLKFIGNCEIDGDIFSFHHEKVILICKGHFNDGVI